MAAQVKDGFNVNVLGLSDQDGDMISQVTEHNKITASAGRCQVWFGTLRTEALKDITSTFYPTSPVEERPPR